MSEENNMNEVPEKKRKPIWKRWWVWVLAILLVIAFAGGDGAEDLNEGVTSSVTSEDSQEEVPEISEEDFEEFEVPPEEPGIVDLDVGISDSEYIGWLSNHNSKMAENLYKLSTLMSSPDMFTDDWVIRTAVVITEIRFLVGEVQEQEYPDNFKDTHSYYLEAANNYGKSMDYLVSGIDNMNPDDLDKASMYMMEGTKNIEKATESISNM